MHEIIFLELCCDGHLFCTASSGIGTYVAQSFTEVFVKLLLSHSVVCSSNGEQGREGEGGEVEEGVMSKVVLSFSKKKVFK